MYKLMFHAMYYCAVSKEQHLTCYFACSLALLSYVSFQEYIQLLMPPLIAKWHLLKDEDRDLFPLLEVSECGGHTTLHMLMSWYQVTYQLMMFADMGIV